MTNTSASDKQTKNSSGATSMAELLAKHEQAVKSFHRGQQIEGTITKLTSSQILVNIGGKSEAIVLEKEKKNVRMILANLHVGDKVIVGVLTPESESGVPVVSLRYFMENRIWDSLDEAKKNQSQVDVTVKEITKGGLVVETKDGLSGFLPQSHMQFSQQQQVAVGKVIALHVLEINRKDNRIIFSQKSAVSDEQFASILKQLPKDTKVSAQIVNVTNFGLFVTVPVKDVPGVEQIDGLVHISEVNWEKVTDLSSMFTVGENVEVIVIGADTEAKRIDFSIKQLSKDPFTELAEKFPVDKKVSGTVTKLVDGNVHLDLGDEVEGIIRKEKVPPTTSYNVGDKVNAVVSEVDMRRRRLTLVPVLLDKPIGYR